MTLRPISYQDLEAWRTLLTLAGDVVDAPSEQRVRRMQRAADRARKAQFPVDLATVRLTFSPLLRLIAGFAETDRSELAGLVWRCRAELQPANQRKDVFG